MSGSKNMSRRFVRGAVLPAAVAWMGLVGTSVGLMQAVCIPQPPAPTPIDVSVAATPGTTVEVNTTVTATATVANATGTVTYSWSQAGVGGLAGSTTSSSVTFLSATAGTAILTVTATDSGTGTSDTATVTITVTAAAPPVSNLAVTGSASPVSGAATLVSTLSATVTGGTAPYSFSWLQTGGPGAAIANASAQTTTVTLTTVGTYTFTVTVTDGVGTSVTSAAVTVSVTSTSLEFTTSPLDDLTGSAGNDTFTAEDGTLQTTDNANGAAGTDLLDVILTGAAALGNPAPSITDIETLRVTDVNTAGASAISAANWTGLATVEVLGSNQNLTVNALTTIPDAAITDANVNLTLVFGGTTTDGTADALALALSNVDGSTFTADGIETFDVESAGADNAVTLVGNALETVNVSGDQAVDLGDLPDTVETLDASAATGDVTAAGFGAIDVTATGGSGDDTLDLNGTYTADDTVNGGAGSDTLIVQDTEAAVADEQTNVTNVETLEVSDAIGESIDLTEWTGVTGLVAAAGFDAAADDVLTVNSGTTVTLEADTANGAATAITIEVGGTGINDALNLVMDDADFAEALDLDGIEVATLVAETDATTIADIEMIPSDPAGPSIGTTTLTISGEENVTLTSATIETIDASALTGDLTATVTAAAEVTGGEGDDTITGSAESDALNGGDGDDTIAAAAGDDAIDGGDGDDTITPGAGADAVTTGDGADAIRYAAVADGSAADPGSASGADLIDDLTAGADGDVLAFNGDVFKDPDDAANTVTGVDLQTVTCDADGTDVVGLVDPADNTVLPIVVVTTTLDDWAALETLCETTIAAAFGGANDAALVVVNVDGIGQLVVFDPDSDTDNDLRVLGQLDPAVALGDLVAENFDEYDN